jgi:lipopolysaccharide export system protein LptA
MAMALAVTAAAQQAPVPTAAAAQAPGGISGAIPDFAGGDLSGAGGGPVEMDATDGIEWRRDENVFIARGNAHVARGDMSVTADSLIAHYRGDPAGKTTVYLVEAIGHVVLVSKDASVTGEHAIYNLDTGSATITGNNLKATSKDQYITARDSLEYWQKEGAVVARGDAVAADPKQRVEADLLTGYFHTDATNAKKLYQVEATGNVNISTQGNIAKAAKAVYNLDSGIAMLEGGVKISRGKNQMNGERAVYNMKTGQAKVTGGKGQVKTLITPGSDTNLMPKP